jgi:hypothetical protein
MSKKNIPKELFKKAVAKKDLFSNNNTITSRAERGVSVARWFDTRKLTPEVINEACSHINNVPTNQKTQELRQHGKK